MNPQHPQPSTPETTNRTAESVLARIASEHLAPTPRYTFLVREYGVWLLWGLSVLVGALAVAVTVYDALSMQYALYEATHDNFWTFTVDALPYVWCLVFLAMIYGATVGIRQTKHGYRYSMQNIVVSSLLCSVFGGLLFHCLGFGYQLDMLLGKQIMPYMSMEKMELARWQNPEQGRLIGMLVPSPQSDSDDADDETLVLQFTDMEGQIWTVTDSELTMREMNLLATKNRVRLVGTTTAPDTFHICGVFPWMYERAMGRSEMQQERAEFEQRMSLHRRRIESRPNLTEPTPIPPPAPDSVCAHLEMMGRLH